MGAFVILVVLAVAGVVCMLGVRKRRLAVAELTLELRKLSEDVGVVAGSHWRRSSPEASRALR
jgi:hypothetical protein